MISNLVADVSSQLHIYGYKALAGEKFIMQCASPYHSHLFNLSESLEKSITWLRYDGVGVLPIDSESIVQQGNFLKFTNVEEKHAGDYLCYSGKERLHFRLDVIPRNGTGCKDHGDSQVTFITGKGGRISCPGVSCYTSPPEVVTWYKGDRSAKDLLLVGRDLKITGTVLLLKTVYLSDKAVFTCDFNYTDGITWTVRRLVEVAVVAEERELLPQILYPYKNCIEEAELGKPKILTCKVQFAFQREFKPVIKWLISYHNGSEEELEMDYCHEDHKSFGEKTITQTARLQQVNIRHLAASFTCFAQNSRGNVTSTLRLTRRPEALQRLEVIIAPVVVLILVTGASVVVQLYRMEIFLLCRAYLPFQVSTAAGKEFDAFVSYTMSSSLEEEVGDVTGEALGLCYLPRVLEQQWEYKLCLLERDLDPGGSYTEEVVRSIQRSQRVICLLNASYLMSPCLFELETALKTLQADVHLKVILVWISTPPAHLRSLPLPRLVRAALRVLPTLHWSPADSTCSETRFWKVLRVAMPKTKVLHCTSSTSGHS
uniref:Uncharacterized protein n=1 Tax=Scleropages formosus TaxID=113540 RepID=A0A8C9RS71_SCLFO